MAAAAVSLRHPQYPSQVRLPDSCSVFTAELRGILLALKHIYQSEEKYFLILSDSLSALQAISTRKITQPLLADIHDIHSKLANRGKIIVFFWVPSHMGIHGNDIVDKAAKSALHLDISEDLLQTVPYRNLRPKTKQYFDKFWQTELSDQINNKLFLLCPDLSQPFPVVGANRKEETVLTRLHVGHTFATHSFLLRGEDPPWCFGCDSPFTVRHILSECMDIYDKRVKYLKDFNLLKIFREINLIYLFKFLKEINLYYKI